jgi:hypothetical protein
MRILVQAPERNTFFDGLDWSADADHAKDFENVAQAEAFCQEHHLTDAMIVVKFKDSRQDIRYPVGERHAVVVSKPPTTRIKSLC